MEIKNYISHHDEIVTKIWNIIEELFDEDTLVIYDIRSSILESVLPHIPYVATYDQRVISLLHHATLVCSEPLNLDVIAYYQELGLCEKAEIITLPHQSTIPLVRQILTDKELCDKLRQRQFKKMITFLPTKECENLAAILHIPLLNSYYVSQAANDKVALKQYTIDSWLPYLPWIITDDAEEMKQYFLSDTQYFFKLAHGVSGFWFFDNKKDSVEDMLAACTWEKIIIEEKIQLIDSPSIQFYSGENEILIIGMTDQILEDGRYYNGNTYPSQWSTWDIGKEIIQKSESVLQYINGLWFRGFGGIDLMISDNKEVYVAEVNARFTWATPALIINILLKQSLTNSRKFLLLDNHNQEDIKWKDKDIHFPISIWWVDEWWKAQYLEWL